MMNSNFKLLFFLFVCLGSAVNAAGTADEQNKQSPVFIGKQACGACHAEQLGEWTGSHHDLAMQPASKETVLGDFNNASFDWFGIENRFFLQDGNYMVRTDGPEGELADYKIAYTFGVFPLQQYLVAFPGGRLQALDIAWDSRPLDQGGQHWMHLHPDDKVDHTDVLHWTGMNLNWNYMCADCHSTNLRKNFDASTNSYSTSWSEIDVSCEACHGPGSAHKEWADKTVGGGQSDQKDMGLTVRLDERKGVNWSIDEKSLLPVRSNQRETSREIEVCARCHSRRSQLTDDFAAGDAFLDGFMPSLLDEGLYHPDGQVLDEVYVWGSFLQSRMHQAGVTCSDCHDPHKADLRSPGDTVCLQCHQADQYRSEKHHFHAPESEGANCVECHMPTTTYMQVDARHDHSFRIPRPDLSVLLDTPNACNKCHADKSATWAADQMLEWYGKPASGESQFAAAVYSARIQQPGIGAFLQQLASDSSLAPIARATILSEMGSYANQQTLQVVQQSLNDPEPLVRIGALNTLESIGGRNLILALPLLWDEKRAVRIEAANVLTTLPAGQLPAKYNEMLEKGIQEYIDVQLFSADRPESQVNLAGIYANLGQFSDAEQAYRQALQLQPRFIPAYINMAQFLSGREREKEAENLLRHAITLIPDNAILNHALGLSLIRQQAYQASLEYLRAAVEQAPGLSRYAYVYAVALQSLGKVADSLVVLEQAHQQSPTDLDILFALTTFHRDAGNKEKALLFGNRLLELLPGNQEIIQMLNQIQTSME